MTKWRAAALVCVAATVLLLWPGFLWLVADGAWSKIRADTPVAAVVVGAEDCATGASFVGPDGVRRTVDLATRVECNARHDVGEVKTLYYDADDPSHVVSDRWLWGDVIGLAIEVLGFPLMLDMLRRVHDWARGRPVLPDRFTHELPDRLEVPVPRLIFLVAAACSLLVVLLLSVVDSFVQGPASVALWVAMAPCFAGTGYCLWRIRRPPVALVLTHHGFESSWFKVKARAAWSEVDRVQFNPVFRQGTVLHVWLTDDAAHLAQANPSNATRNKFSAPDVLIGVSMLYLNDDEFRRLLDHYAGSSLAIRP